MAGKSLSPKETGQSRQESHRAGYTGTAYGHLENVSSSPAPRPLRLAALLEKGWDPIQKGVNGPVGDARF